MVNISYQSLLSLSLPPLPSLYNSIHTATHILTCDGVGINDLRPRLLVLGVLPVPISVSVFTAAVVVLVLGGELGAELTVDVSPGLESALGEPAALDTPPDSLLCVYMVQVS